jgi:hypothetical protein
MSPKRRGRDPGKQLKQRPFTSEDVKQILSNPAYVGMGNVPRLIDDEMWFRTQVRLVEELGAEETLTHIRTHLLTGFRSVRTVESPTWVADSVQAIATDDADAFFRRLLVQLRTELGWPPGESPSA